MLLLHFVPLGADFPTAVGPEGFVHLCWGHQAAEVLRRHFGGGPARALVIDVDALDATLFRQEDTYGHGAYPHYYGPLSKDWVVAVHTLKWGEALWVDGAPASEEWEES